MPKVLLIDDEEGIRLVGQRILEDLGCEVGLAKNAREAMALFTKDNFALVITDLKIPGQEGLSLIQEIRALKPGQPVLVISGGNLEAGWFTEAAGEAGNINTLGKPFEIETLANLVREILANKT